MEDENKLRRLLTMTRWKRFWALAVVGIGLSSVSFLSAQVQAQGPSRPTPTPTPNGISVGRPKVFDNRTLTLMLESLSSNLQNMQFVNRDSLSAAFAFLQGSRSSDVTTNFSLGTLPIPSLHQENTTNTGLVNSAGAALPDTTTQKTVSERAAISPTAPTLDAAAGFPAGFSPSFGQNPADLLSDQVNLTYQIFNLRMILERSLSDRLLGDMPRRQAVLGFNVTIDPPRTADDAVAVVEITLNADGCDGKKDGCLSLVSLMPQEKTYNSAAVSNKSHAFGGAAVVNIFQVGFSQRNRSQVFYLYRDNDTISYERMDPDSGKIIFGWMFRPVLGRRSVSPGLRQMFAIVALPTDDEPETNGSVTKGSSTRLDAVVRTYWKKYDGNTMTSFEERDTNRAGRIKNALTFGLTKPEIFVARYGNEATYSNIEVKPTADYQAALSPVVTAVSWRATGAKSVLISAQGKNFFSETKVAIGDKTYATTDDGLILKSNQAFDLKTTLDALANGPGAVIGRYGLGVPLTLNDAGLNVPKGGIVIDRLELAPAFGSNRVLDIYLTDPDTGQPLRLHNQSATLNKMLVNSALNTVPQDQDGGDANPIVTINGSVVPLPYKLSNKIENGVVTALILTCNVPDSLVPKDGGLVRVSFPFLPDRWTANKAISNPASQFQITRLGANSIVIHTNNWLGFTRQHDGSYPAARFCWNFRAGDKSLDLASDTCTPKKPAQAQATPRTRKGAAKKVSAAKTETKPDSSERISDYSVAVTLVSGVPDKIVLIDPDGAVYSLDVPKDAAPGSTDPKPIMLNQNDSVWVDLAVSDAAKVVGVEVNQSRLGTRFEPAKDGKPVKILQVHVTQDITAKPSDMDMTVTDTDGKVSKFRLHISCTQTCTDRGGKQ
jgi:hypothetical protein